MNAKNTVIETTSEKVEDNIDLDKLSILKAKMKNKENVVKRKETSIKFGVIGSGQAGSRLAAVFNELGYTAIAINTASQDLKHINLPESNKLLIQYGLGGCAGELTLGKEAAESYKEDISNLIDEKLSDSQVNILCLSLGGGSGAGSCETLVDILSAMGKPLVVMTVLPMSAEDIKIKSNALETLSKLSKLTQSKKISNLIVIDNAKLEAQLSDVSQLDFFNIANKIIIDPLDTFNTLSAIASPIKPLDPTEFAKILTDGEGLSTYGVVEVKDYQEETAIAEAVLENLNSNLLASGFDLKEAKYVGIIVAANRNVLSKIPSSYLNYAFALIEEQSNHASGVYKGTYVVDTEEDSVKVYSFFSGLGLPQDRINNLKTEVQRKMETVKSKEGQRNLSLNLETGSNETISAAQKIKDKIAAKSSAFGKLTGPIDRRK